MPCVAVIGASGDRSKFGNKAVRAYARREWTVHPVNPKGEPIEGLRTFRSIGEVPHPVDRVALYVPPEVGERLLPGIAAARPGEVWVNPGAGSETLLTRARALGLAPIEGCAILAIGEDPGAP